MQDIPHSLTPQDCLIAVMMAVSASDEEITSAELLTIERIVNHLPVFATYDPDRFKTVSQTVFDLFAVEDGLDALFGLVRDNLPETCGKLPMRWLAMWPPLMAFCRPGTAHLGRDPVRAEHRPAARCCH